LVGRLYQLALGCGGEGTDVELYQRYAGALRTGAAASPDFRPEYPPAALVLAALHCLDRHRERLSAALLGIAPR
jgi:hypothetical protein